VRPISLSANQETALRVHSLVPNDWLKMRLLHASTFKLHDFSGDIPAYAILSHRWETEEILFQDVEAGKARRMTGFAKIEGCCQRATADNIEFVWIDTCCIDKTSSAELSEAINSMYQWYQDAQVCYAYLSDVQEGRHEQFSESKWFTRGWTLQELLAPSFVVFYDCSWNEIGTKGSLRKEITTITGINSLFDIDQACVAEKMSWASGRVTTRLEDTAYCLMGLFGVHMTPLYGEGHNAFVRLQLEILSRSDDESIFAWQGYMSDQGGLLASSPKAFADSGDIEIFPYDEERPQFAMTNKGLRLDLRLEKPLRSSSWGNANGAPKFDTPTEYLAPLNCGRLDETEDEIFPVAIKLKQQGQHGQYMRVHDSGLELWKAPKNRGKPRRQTVYIKQPIGSLSDNQKFPELSFYFEIKTTAIFGYSVSGRSCFCPRCESWDISKNSLTITENTTHCNPLTEMDSGAILFSKKDAVSFAVVLGISGRKYPTANIFVPGKPHELEMEVDQFNMSRPQNQQNFLLDRASETIKGGLKVSIALRPIRTHRYLVDITLVEPPLVRAEDIALPDDISIASSIEYWDDRKDSGIFDVFSSPDINESPEDSKFFDNLEFRYSKGYGDIESPGDFIIFDDPKELDDLKEIENPKELIGSNKFDDSNKHDTSKKHVNSKKVDIYKKRHTPMGSDAYIDLKYTFYPNEHEEDLIALP
jgi:hypothetical protein